MSSPIGRLLNKSGVVFGYANTRSIAWSIAEAWNNEGAKLTISIANERFRSSLEKATLQWKQRPQIIVCDVNNDEQIKEAGNRIAEYHQGNVNLLAHCIAYAPTFARKASFLDTTRNEFLETQAISTYSLIGITKELYPYMKTVTVPPSSLQSTVDTVSSKSSLSSANVSTPTLSSSSSITTNSIIALSYIGAHRASSTYGIMSTAKASLESTVRSLALDLGKDGVRVNTISAGPIATLASRGIPGFTTMRDETVRKTPLKMNIESKDIGNLATFLASNDASMITGQTIYVDGGFSSVL